MQRDATIEVNIKNQYNGIEDFNLVTVRPSEDFILEYANQ